MRPPRRAAQQALWTGRMSTSSPELTPWTAPVDAVTRSAIEQLITEHAWLVDHGRADRLHELYCAHGTITGAGLKLAGREAIAAWGRERVRSGRTARHVCTNIRLVQAGENRVLGHTIITLYRSVGTEGDPSPTPMAVGDWRDVYERTPEGRWLIAERKIVVLFESPAHRGGRPAASESNVSKPHRSA
jgi:hypothetical protein